MEAQKLAI